jgi:hypothetical protein
MTVLAERIVGLARRLEILVADRDMGAAERLCRILPRHQARIIWRDAERERTLMADHGLALVLRQDKHPLKLGERADARARLPAPIVPLGGIHLGVIALAEGARERPDGEALHADDDRVEPRLRSACGRRGRKSIDRGLWLDEESGCRLGATGRLFGLDLKQLHGMSAPSWLATDRPWRQPPALVRRKRESFQRACYEFQVITCSRPQIF